MGVQAQRLRALLEIGENVVAADCYSALTARIVEHVGFKAAYAGGHACGAFHYAAPGCGVYSQARAPSFHGQGGGNNRWEGE